jgi:IMP dehydrogenase/GMP reductase
MQMNQPQQKPQDATQLLHDGKGPPATCHAPVGIDSVLAARFKLVKLIGEGGMSNVFKAIDLRKVGAGARDPHLAVKVLTAVGVPQITGVANVAAALKGSGVPLIADGGIRFSGDIAKALVAGAHCVMIGGLFAGTEESPGEVELYQGASYKSYRGMGSLGAMQEKFGSKDRYFQDATEELEKLVPEGVEGRVPYKGSLVQILQQLAGGLRAAMGYTGCRTIEEMRTRPSFVRITGAGVRESHVQTLSWSGACEYAQTRVRAINVVLTFDSCFCRTDVSSARAFSFRGRT